MNSYKLDLEKYAALARQAVAEGCVLLENEGQALPLRDGERVAVFGRMAFHYYKSGLGSGGLVNTRYVVGILDALKECEGVHLDEKLMGIYEDWIMENPYDEGQGWGRVPWCQKEMDVTEEMLDCARRDDVSLVVIGRTAGEDQDNNAKAGSYCLTETEEDIVGIAELGQRIVNAYYQNPDKPRGKGVTVSVSVSCFVPKPFTPFQWEPQDTQEMVREKQSHLREKLRIKGVTFNYHESDLSYLEACFARGDRRMGQVLLRAYQKGCMLDGWTELFKYDMWREAFAELGIDPAFYAYRRREKDEIMPWDVIDCGVTKEFLWREKEKAEKAQTTKDCRKGCNGCGLQRFKGVCKYCG